MATIDLMDKFGNLGSGGIKNNGALDAEITFLPALCTMRTDFIQVKAGDSIAYKNMNGMSSSWNIISFYTGEAQGYYVSGIAGQTTPQSGVWTAQQDGYVRLFGSFPAGDKISVTMTDLAPDVEDYLSQYNAMNYRFLPNSIPKIVAHIQEYLSNHPIADSTTLQSVIDAAFKSYLEEIQETADTYIAEAVPPAAAAAVDAAASPALAEITAKTAEAAESARQAGLSQQSAEMSEENALTYRNQAQQIKDSITSEVSASVLAAQEQATLAQESAQAADESADTAEQYLAQARAQAEAAADHAQTASGYASDAQGYMQDASGFAQNASDFADNAAQSAATFSTDPTLTISGKAADAKATGDQLSDLKSALRKVKRAERINILDLMQTNGGVYATNGGDNNSSSVVSAFRRTDYISVSAGDVVEYHRIRADGMCIIAFYASGITFDANNSVTGDSTPLSGAWTAPSDGTIRACCRITEIQSGTSYAYADYNLYRLLQKNEDFPNVVSHGLTQIINMLWSVGFISSTTGEVSSGISAIITRDYYTLEEKPIIIRKPLNSQLQIYAYSDGSFTRTGVDSAVMQFTFTPSSAMTYRFCYYRFPYETADIETFKSDIAIGYTDDLFVTSRRYSDASGKKWVTIGDSLTDPVTLSGYSGEETKNYTNIVAERLGLTLSNVGVSGSGYWRKSTISPYKGFYQVAETIDIDADIVTIFGSFNDMGADGDTSGRRILGTIYDDGTDTVGGCVNQAIKNVIARVPNAVIGIILPTPWNAMTQTASELTAYEAYTNLVKGVAERYSLPVLDLFHHSNLRPWDDTFKATYYNNADGVHPNHYGHMRISGYIADFVESLAKLN